MALRTRIFQKIAETNPAEPNNDLGEDNTAPKPADLTGQIPSSQEKEPVDAMKVWEAFKSNPNVDLSVAIRILARDILKGQPFDWDLVIEEIVRRNDKAAANALVHNVPGIDPSLPDRVGNNVTTEEEALAYFNETIASLGYIEVKQNFIKSFISKYKSIITDWKWLFKYYIDGRYYPELVDTIISFPDVKIASETEMGMIIRYHNLDIKDLIKLMKTIPMDSRNIDEAAGNFHRYGAPNNVTLQDLIEIFNKQNHDENFYQIPFTCFLATGSEEFLKFYLQFLPNTHYWMIHGIISYSDESVALANLKKFLRILGGQLNEDSVLKVVYLLHDAGYLDFLYLLFSNLKGKPRLKVLFKYLSYTIPIEVFDKFINDLTANEMTELCSAIFNYEVSHSTMALLFVNKRSDKSAILKSMIEKSEYEFALKLIKSPDVNKNDFDVVLLQKFIEQSGGIHSISELLNSMEARDKKINFSAGKRKYNERYKAKYLQTPEREAQYVSELYFGGAAWSPETKSFLEEAVSKKDWFFANMETVHALFSMGIITFFLKTKGKQGRDLYHEVKNDNYLVIKLKDLKFKQDDYSDQYRRCITTDFATTLINMSTNIGQFVKLLDKSLSACKLQHDVGVSTDLVRSSILNQSIDIEDPSVRDFLEVCSDLATTDLTSLNKTLDSIIAENPSLINKEEFNKNYQIFHALKENLITGKSITLKRGSPEYVAFKNFHTQTSLIEQYETIRTYVKEAKPKDSNLEKFNWTHPSGLTFKVLKYLDPYAFQVGSDTECCQRVGGAGEEAAIDSFINPLAGVLIVTNEEDIISQSYFHFVPQDNGLILDNVEWNSKNADASGLSEASLSKVYHEFAMAMKKAYPELTYVKCGTAYNKLDNDLFQTVSMDGDPRHFEVDDPYSDFDEEEHLDLLTPNENMKHVEVNLKTPKEANKIINLIRLATARRMFFQRSLGL